MFRRAPPPSEASGAIENGLTHHEVHQGLAVRRLMPKSTWLMRNRTLLIAFCTLALIADILLLILYSTEYKDLGPRSIVVYVLIWLCLVMYVPGIVHKVMLEGFTGRLWRDFALVVDSITILVVGIWLLVRPWSYIPYFAHVVVIPSRVHRLLRLQKRALGHTPFREDLIILVVTVIIILVFYMFTFQALETGSGRTDLTLFDSLYFVMVSVSTIGYGDITPDSELSRLMVVWMIVVIIVVLPNLVSEAVHSYNLQHSGGGSYTTRYAIDFVVILGRCGNVHGTFDILNAFFSKEHSKSNFDLVFMSPEPMSHVLRTLLNESIYVSRVVYLVGDGCDTHDMERLCIDKALAVFILAGGTQGDVKEESRGSRIHEDERNTLRLWSVRNHNESVPVYVYNNFAHTENFQRNATPFIVCLDNFKQCLLAQHLLYPGVGTFLICLLYQTAFVSRRLTGSAGKQDPYESSVSVIDAAPQGDEESSQGTRHGTRLTDDFAYKEGVGHELYSVMLPLWTHGQAFDQVALALYQTYGILFIGVQSNHGQVKLSFTGIQVISPEDMGIFIAQSEKSLADALNAPISVPVLITNVFTQHDTQTLDMAATLDKDEDQPPDGTVIGKPNLPYFDSHVPLCYLTRQVRHSLDVPSDIAGHMVVVTSSMAISKMVSMLRRSCLTWREALRPILIFVTANAADQDKREQGLYREKKSLAQFPFVYLMTGDHRQPSDLEQLRIPFSHSIMILALDDEDTSAIMLFHFIKALVQGIVLNRPRVNIEITSRNSLRFFKKVDWQVPVLPNVVRNGFRNGFSRVGTQRHGRRHEESRVATDRPPLRDRLHSMTHGPREPFFLHEAMFAAGLVVPTSSLDTILYQTFHNPPVLNVIRCLCGMRDTMFLRSLPASCLPPRSLFGVAFERLLAERSVILVGIFRRQSGLSGQDDSLVIINPRPTLVIGPFDDLFVV